MSSFQAIVSVIIDRIYQGANTVREPPQNPKTRLAAEAKAEFPKVNERSK